MGIQLVWVLRPFIDAPNSPPEFLRANVFQENAYEVVFRLGLYAATGDWRAE